MSEEMHLPKEEIVAEYLEELTENGLTEEEIAKKINVSQSTVSRLLNKGMGLSYDSAYKAIILIQEYLSPFPSEPIKNFSYPRANDVKSMSSDELLQEASLVMKQGGYTQIPIYEKTNYDRNTGEEAKKFVGILTDLGLLKRMSNPLKSSSKEKWLQEMSRLTIKEADVIERVPSFPDDSSLIEIVEGLYHHYALLITEEAEDKVGIITRNDLTSIWLELISTL